MLSQYRSQAVLVGAVFVLFMMYVALPSDATPQQRVTYHMRGSRLKSVPSRLEFLIVTDLDKKSAITTSAKPRWRSWLKKVG